MTLTELKLLITNDADCAEFLKARNDFYGLVRTNNFILYYPVLKKKILLQEHSHDSHDDDSTGDTLEPVQRQKCFVGRQSFYIRTFSVRSALQKNSRTCDILKAYEKSLKSENGGMTLTEQERNKIVDAVVHEAAKNVE